jgi:lipopolysaccharide biosynthesis glycosyltransferase
MDFDTFKKAVSSMSGFKGIVGIMGGEPTLHPEFARFAVHFRDNFGVNDNRTSFREPLRDFVGYIIHNAFDINRNNHRGLWSSTGKGYLNNFEIIQDTFGYQAINDHMNASMHEALMVTRKELGIPDKEWFPLRDNCWIQNLWSASITPKGTFFCEIAASMDMLLDGPGGWPIEPGWWKRKPVDFKDQLHWCELCSAPLAMPSRDAREEIDDVSPVWYEMLKARKGKKTDLGKVKVFDVKGYDRAKYKVINESLPYMEDQTQRIGKANRVFYPDNILGILRLKNGVSHEEGERLIEETAKNFHLFAVISDDGFFEKSASSKGAEFWHCSGGDCDTRPWFNALRRAARSKSQWVALFHSYAPSATLAERLGAKVFNPGCFYFSPLPVDLRGGGEKFCFFNLNAMALRECNDLRNLSANYPSDKTVALGEHFDITAKIYLAHHSPDTEIIANNIFIPIHSGKAVSDKQPDMAGDDTGDNISDRNREYAELTVHYWAWKNNTRDEHIGLMHYRRLFVFSDGHDREVNHERDRVVVPFYESWMDIRFGWASNDILEFIAPYDVIVPLKYDVRSCRRLDIYDVESHFIAMHGRKGYDAFRKAIENYAPDYIDSMKEIMKEDNFYLCNMFVMKRWVFEKYSEWLFDLLDKSSALHAWNAGTDTAYQRRMPAFWAERMLNVFLKKLAKDHPHIMIREIPYVFLENTTREEQSPLEPLVGVVNPITVVTSFDNNYAPCFGVLLLSMIEHSSKDNFYDLIVLNDSISEENQAVFADMLAERPNFSLRYIDMRGKFTRSGSAHGHFTKASFHRLLLPELLGDYKKISYIDPDIVVLKDIAELHCLDIKNHYAGVCLDLTFKWMRKSETRIWDYIGDYTVEEYFDSFLRLSFDAKEKFFNAGVMVLNLDKIRDDYLMPAFLQMLNEGVYYTVDQCILNKVFNGNILLLPAKWNHIVRPLNEMIELQVEYATMYREAAKDPAIIHFAGPDLKPWHKPDVPFGAVFWQYCSRSPYFRHFMDILVGNSNKHPEMRRCEDNAATQSDYNQLQPGRLRLKNLAFNFIKRKTKDIIRPFARPVLNRIRMIIREELETFAVSLKHK